MPRKKTERRFKKGDNFPKFFNDEDFVPDLDCTAKQAYNRLRKSWRKFRIAKSTGDEISLSEAMDAINEVQRGLKIPVTDFENYEPGEFE